MDHRSAHTRFSLESKLAQSWTASLDVYLVSSRLKSSPVVGLAVLGDFDGLADLRVAREGGRAAGAGALERCCLANLQSGKRLRCCCCCCCCCLECKGKIRNGWFLLCLWHALGSYLLPGGPAAFGTYFEAGLRAWQASPRQRGRYLLGRGIGSMACSVFLGRKTGPDPPKSVSNLSKTRLLALGVVRVVSASQTKILVGGHVAGSFSREMMSRNEGEIVKKSHMGNIASRVQVINAFLVIYLSSIFFSLGDSDRRTELGAIENEGNGADDLVGFQVKASPLCSNSATRLVERGGRGEAQLVAVDEDG